MINIGHNLTLKQFLKRLQLLEREFTTRADDSDWSSIWQLRCEVRNALPYPQRVNAFACQTSQDDGYDAPDSVAAYQEDELKLKKFILKHHSYLWPGILCVVEPEDLHLAIFIRANSANRSHYYVHAMNMLSSASQGEYRDLILPEDVRCAIMVELGVIHLEEVEVYLKAMSSGAGWTPFNVMEYRMGQFLFSCAVIGDRLQAMKADQDALLWDEDKKPSNANKERDDTGNNDHN